MNTVDVHSRLGACAVNPTPGTVVISISNPGKPAPLVDGWEAVLRLEFHDYVNLPEGVDDAVLFSEAMGDTVNNFVVEHCEKNFLIHCDAGVSRSVAVGVFISDVFGHELTLHAIHNAKAANNLVLRTLKRRYWEEQFSR